MALFLECIGLDIFEDEEEGVMALCAWTTKEGRPIIGYDNTLYLYNEMGGAQLTATAKIGVESEQITVERLDSHSVGNAVWNVRVVSELDDGRRYGKRLLVKNTDGNGLAVVNLIGSDVLPSFLPDEEITMQMTAFPINVQYFKDEDDYAALYPEGANGKRLIMGDGTVIPFGLFSENDDSNEEQDKENDIVHIRGTIQGVYESIAKFKDFDENECPKFIRCVIDTEFGKLDIVHPYEILRDNNMEKVKKGCICSVNAVLSGDVAIYKYEKGIVKDHETNLHALAYSMVQGNSERIRCILSDQFHYFSEVSKKDYHEVKQFFQRIKIVQENRERIEVRFATIVDILPQDETHTEETKFEVGERCFVIRYDDEENYSAIVFIKNNENGLIQSINISNNPRYIFQVDESAPKLELFDEDSVLPDTLTSMIMRARLSLKVSDELENKDIITKIESDSSLRDHAQSGFDASMEQKDKIQAVKKALEYFYKNGFVCEAYDLNWTFCTSECFGTQSEFTRFEEYRDVIQEAGSLSQKFYMDLRAPIDDYDGYKEDVIKALACAEFLGRHLAILIKGKNK